jgi:uncharacterized Tic20 family protein
VRRSRLTPEEQRWAPLVHVAALPAMLLGLGFLGPLLLGRLRGGVSPFVRHHVVQAVNFNLAVGVAGTVTLLVMAFGAGSAGEPAPGEPPEPQWVPATALSVLIVLLVLWFLLIVRAALGAREGEWYRYPVSVPVMR